MSFSTASRDHFEHWPGLFSREVMNEVRAHFDEMERDKQQAILGPRDEKARRLGTGTDSFRLDTAWYALWRSISPAAIDRLRPFTWVLYPAQIRHITTPEQLVPWHQDIGYQTLLGARAHAQLITCFVPVEFEPSQVATLEFARGSFPLLPHVVQGDHGACIVSTGFDDKATFTLECGDALVFGDHAPHRTVVPPHGKIDRRSFEFGLIDPAMALDSKDYFDLDRRCFVKTDGTEQDQP